MPNESGREGIEGRGAARLAPARPWLRAVAAALALLAWPCLATPAVAEIFFGDLHAHSELSDDASNPPEAFFLTARDVAGLDFVALSDHDIFLSANEWEILKTVAASFDDPGRFVAFSAIEWSQTSWHMNVYFLGDEEEYCPGPSCYEAHEFYEFYGPRVAALEAAAQVNHPRDPFFPVTWSTIDDSITTSVEVWNTGATGSQEHGHGGALWALRAGFQLGLVGVSDDHHSERRPPLLGTGLTGCHADALTRADLLDAIRARRCFATDGERIRLDLEVGGVPMGGEASASIGDRVAARVEVVATATPVTVELLRGGVTVATVRCDTPVCDLDASVRVVDPSDFVYARVAQADGHHAWSSPVWVRSGCRGAAPGATRCLASRLADGGGLASADCLARWLAPAGGARPTRGTTARLTCRDGDPRCDAGDEPGTCSFALGLCFAVDDPAGRACAAGEVDGFEVVEPAQQPRIPTDPVAAELRETVLAMYRASSAGTAKPGCTPLSRLSMPIGTRTVHIRTHAGSAADDDRLELECTPARATRARLPILRPGRGG